MSEAVNSDYMLSQLSWLEGSWERTRKGKTPAYESWTRSSDTEFRGHGFAIDSTGDTTSFEHLRIFVRPSSAAAELVYSADVAHNDGAVEFACITLLSDGEAVGWEFRNPEHDFPQAITYFHVEGEETMRVEVSGPDGKGGRRVLKFDFRRARN